MRHTKSLCISATLALVGLLFLVPAVYGAACQFHRISGWIWSWNVGWISLDCNNTGANFDYGLDIDFESGNPTEPVTGYAWSSNAGWIDFQPSGPYPASPANAAQFNRSPDGSPTTTAGTLTGWAKFTSYGDDGWMKLGPLDIGGTDYGVQINTSRVLSGWSWNGGDDLGFGDPEPEQGFGWVHWDGEGYGGELITYWFETLYGNVYSGGNLDAIFAPPSGKYTATYLLQANGTIDPVTITSPGGTSEPYRSESYGALTLPQSSNNYFGTLGLLDRVGMLNGYYGTVTTYAGDNVTSNTLGANKLLDGGLYHYTGNLTVDSGLTFTRGSGSQNGGGTIIVNGNLTINANIDYQSGAVSSRIDNLPSAGWIVSGNITINPAVTNIVGVFYSEGAGGITTGTTGDVTTDVPLTVSGIFIAKGISLQRTPITAGNPPGEQIIFDGRALANPPPGLADVVKGLPTLREVIP